MKKRYRRPLDLSYRSDAPALLSPGTSYLGGDSETSIHAPVDAPFWVMIRPTNSDIEPYGFATGGGIPAGFDEKVIVIAQYTPDGGVIPDEFEIQVVFPGCDIYQEIVTWP